jgi:hypothetical protein
MSDARKRSSYNEHIQEMHERKEATEENKRLERILSSAHVHSTHKRLKSKEK